VKNAWQYDLIMVLDSGLFFHGCRWDGSAAGDATNCATNASGWQRWLSLVTR